MTDLEAKAQELNEKQRRLLVAEAEGKTYEQYRVIEDRIKQETRQEWLDLVLPKKV